ncbi:MAG: metal ABC transporter ATP-binding protein [Thermoplasmatota archaeon]
MDEKALEIRDLDAGYGPEAVIRDIDLDVMHGDFFGLIGPNGGGKSTLLKVILGLLKPMKGTVKVYGSSPESSRKYLGYVPQYAEFDRDFPITVWKVVLMGRRRNRGLFPWYTSKDREAAEKALKAVDIYDLRKKHISSLSGGQKQRAFIARALVTEPKLLLLDEPTASVDARIQENIYRLLSDLNENMTIILVTHDVGIISSYVGSVACLNKHMFKNDEPVITREMLEESYQCPVDLIAHGIPHRVLAPHDMGVENR